MGKVPFTPNLDIYRQHYGGALPVFRGYKHQKGAGFFGNLLKSAIPIIKSGGKKLLGTTLKTGANILSDVLTGDSNFETAFRNRGKEALTDIKKSVVKNVASHRQVPKSAPKKRKAQNQSKKQLNKKRKPATDVFTKY